MPPRVHGPLARQASRSRGTSSTRSTTSSGKNLNWFWKRLVLRQRLHRSRGDGVTPRRARGYTVTIENIGGHGAPFDLTVLYAGRHQRRRSTRRRRSGRRTAGRRTVTVHRQQGRSQSLTIDGGIWMDADTEQQQLDESLVVGRGRVGRGRVGRGRVGRGRVGRGRVGGGRVGGGREGLWLRRSAIHARGTGSGVGELLH